MSHLLCQANALRIPLADESVQCCVTSPPYWGLRDYGTAQWIGGDATCDHAIVPGPVTEKYKVCRCGARRVDNQIGLEPTPDEFVAKMVAVFREVWRVLRDDATCWINIGDSYNGYYANQYATGLSARNQHARQVIESGAGIRAVGLKPKDLVGIPWRLAFALQADGWYLRSDIIWHKPNPMPESVTDRPTKSHEYLFLLTKSERYYFDAEAIREPHVDFARGANGTRVGSKDERTENGVRTGTMNNIDRGGAERAYNPAGRNIRSVWTIPTESYPGSHFATFPRKLVEPCVKAGTSERGCCSECGKCWEREVESERVQTRPGSTTKIPGGWMSGPGSHNGIDGRYAAVVGNRDPGRHVAVKTTKGWHPACSCNAAPVPCVVLDPFSGSGTTGVVANALGRSYVGLDLNAEYIGLSTQRINHPHAPVKRPGKPETFPLFGEMA